MQQRDHYAALDGLRGFAAVSVLLFHLGHWKSHHVLATNANYAVDFFFCLSGFVISIAYKSKIESGMGAFKFLKIRLVRLMPIIVIGTLISAAYLVARILWLHDDAIAPLELATATLLGMLSIPMFTASKAIGGPDVFPLNGPQYTLFLELVVNAFWVVTHRAVGLWTALAIALACYAASATFGMTGDKVENFWTGFPRVFGSFYMGVAVYHAQQRFPLFDDERWKSIFFPLAILTAIFFYWPRPTPYWMGWTWSVFVPALFIISGSKVKLTGNARSFGLFLGELSYPMYGLHYPIFVWVNAMYQETLDRKYYFVGNMLVILAVFAGSWLILRLFDEPLRVRIGRLVLRRATPAIA
jgi:peptidoglycan/LPS O-acetylase OafA/YrhL